MGQLISDVRALLTLLVFALISSVSTAQTLAQSDQEGEAATGAETAVVRNEQQIENPFPQRFPAPSLDGGVGWLNTSAPIELRELRGKIVLLDFWTYCCINCIHVLPDLKYLEEKYANELVVIGVHSAKFENEKEIDAIRDAVLRYGIVHPVINDANMVIWRKFLVRSWPTFVLMDPEGNFCGTVSGEGNRDILEQAIDKLIAYHASRGTLDRTPLHFELERENADPTPLRYPGKVLADAASDRLYVSDSSHNRIVVSTLDGELIETIGSGRIGRQDGSYGEAELDHPQGMALDGDILYVADTENHLIRKVDVATKTVTTLAGTGSQASFRDVASMRAAGGPLEKTSLSSPWDLLIHNGVLYIAMAGPHQIWSHKLDSTNIRVFAGSGREDVINGRHLQSALAQPSGLASDGEALYVCDSEGSSIRRIPFSVRNPVTTIAGPSDMPGGQTLFEFGDTDGVGNAARFQHPLGIAIDGTTLFIADSYNHKVKTVSLAGRAPGTVESLLGDGTAANSLDPVRVSEPAGLSFADSSLFIADTNNHRVLRVDPGTKKATVLPFAGLEPPSTETLREPSAQVTAADAVTVPPQTVRAGQNLSITVEVTLPEGYKLNPAFPTAATVGVEGPNTVIAGEGIGKRLKGEVTDSTFQFGIPLNASAGTGNLRIAVNYGYCFDGKGGVCKVKTAHFVMPVVANNSGVSEIRLQAPAAESPLGN